MLASGNVPVQFLNLTSGFTGTDETVALMSKLSHGRWGARSPKIRALAINILREAGVPEKAYRQEMVALHNWVRDRIRYTKDVVGQETLCPPEELAFNSMAGDCDDKSMLLAALLGSVGISSRYKVIGITPRSYSHVYLQARPGPPGSAWISLDPIMKGKPAGWEAPKHMVKIQKTYPENAPEDNMPRNINGLGYVGDPRIVSHLDPEPAQEERSASPYVVMDSMLDTDLPIEAITNNQPAFPQDAHYPDQRMPSPRLLQVRPKLLNVRQAEEVSAMVQNEDAPFMYHPFEGLGNELMGPEQLAAMGADNVQRSMGKPRANMQRPALVQKPEGIDVMFGRRAEVMNGSKGDRIVYRGLLALSERPPIRPYDGVGGLPSGALPGMGVLARHSLSGPGIGDLAELAADAPAMVAAPAPASNTGKIVAGCLVAVGAYLLMKRMKRA
jgi:hypothetical protein